VHGGTKTLPSSQPGIPMFLIPFWIVNFLITDTVVLQFVGPTLSGTSQFVGPGFGSTLVLAGISILRKIIKYVVHTY
jgi:hypothetical protein